MNFRPIADIDNDIANKQQELEQTTHEIQRSILVNAITDLESEKFASQEALERIKLQTEAVESITLPLDFNDLFGNPLANETIIELLQQSKLQANEECNTLVDEVNAGWKTRLDELTSEWETTRTQLYKATIELQAELDQEKDASASFARIADAEKEKANQLGIDLNQSRNDNDELRTQIAQLTFEKNDLFNKRNAAANALIEANRQIEILKTPPSPKPSIITVNDHLADLAARAKQSTLDQINKNLERFGVPALNIPDSPLAEPQIEPLNNVLDKAEDAETIPSSPGDQVDAAGHELVEGTPSDQGQMATEESQIALQERPESDTIDFTYGHLKQIWQLQREIAEIKSQQAAA